MLGGSEGQGGRRGLGGGALRREESLPGGGALTTCASLGSLRSPDWPSATPGYRKSRGEKLAFNIDLFLHTFQGMLVTLS